MESKTESLFADLTKKREKITRDFIQTLFDKEKDKKELKEWGRILLQEGNGNFTKPYLREKKNKTT